VRRITRSPRDRQAVISTKDGNLQPEAARSFKIRVDLMATPCAGISPVGQSNRAYFATPRRPAGLDSRRHAPVQAKGGCDCVQRARHARRANTFLMPHLVVARLLAATASFCRALVDRGDKITVTARDQIFLMQFAQKARCHGIA